MGKTLTKKKPSGGRGHLSSWLVKDGLVFIDLWVSGTEQIERERDFTNEARVVAFHCCHFLSMYMVRILYVTNQCAYDVAPGGQTVSQCVCLTRMVRYRSTGREVCIKQSICRKDQSSNSVSFMGQSAGESDDMLGIGYENHTRRQRILLKVGQDGPYVRRILLPPPPFG